MKRISRIPAGRSFDAKEPFSFFCDKNRNGRTTSLMWLLRASTQSTQMNVHPVRECHSKEGSIRHQQVMGMLSEALDEGVEVAFGHEDEPFRSSAKTTHWAMK